MELLIVAVILLTVILVASLYANIRMYRKEIVYESRLTSIYDDVTHLIATINNIDNMKIFEDDDDVGAVFAKLKELVNTLGKYLIIEDEEDKEV